MYQIVCPIMCLIVWAIIVPAMQAPQFSGNIQVGTSTMCLIVCPIM